MNPDIDVLDGVAEVPWSRLYHAYGPAVDVPERLLTLRGNDPDTRAEALSLLSGSVCHQNTRWQASAHVVPFLARLVDDLSTSDRGKILSLLGAIALGNLRDDSLPFDAAQEFADGADVTERQIAEVVRRVFEEEDPSCADDSEFMDLAERVVVRWAADAYWAAAAHVDLYRMWLDDTEVDVAAQAAALLVWFPPTDATVEALLAVPAVRMGVRASANLALAHLPDSRADVDKHLTMLLGSGDDLVALTAATALAFRDGERLPAQALTRLVEASEANLPDGVLGWDRAPRGFVALALQRLRLPR